MKHCSKQVVVLAAVIIAVCLQGGVGQNQKIDIVPCRDQQEACVCNEEAKVCQFRLEIEELQTFVSYRIGVDGELITRGTPGDSYFVSTSGYQASLSSALCEVTDDNPKPPPECGRCWTAMIFTNEQTFKDMNCSVPMTVDGRSYRLYIAVNGRIPGPTLVVTEDQIVLVDVVNRLTSEGVTIHWHGMHQQKTPWMDGVASLSQIPIVPGASFRYIFKASPAGTHWYHSHLGAQRTDGLFGGLVVHERSDMQEKVTEALGTFLDLPEEHTLTLLDWQRESSLSLFVQIHSTLGFYPNKQLGDVPRNEDQLYSPRTVSSDNIEVGPVPYWSGLINGKGRYDSSTYSILSIFNVTQGTSYRFRLIGAQSLYAYRFEIQGHQLTVVATDGYFIQPRTVDYVIIHSGERFDFLLNATQPLNNYLIRATTLETSIWEPEVRTPGIHTAEAILHYNGATPPDPRNRYGFSNAPRDLRSCGASNRCTALNCPFRIYSPSNFTDCIVIDELRSLFPSDESDLPKLNMVSGEDRLKFFNFGFEGQSSTSAINGRNFLPPPSPYQVYQGQYDADLNDESVNTCSACNEMTTNDTQAEQCTCIHVEEIVTNENSGSDSDKSVMMVFSAVGANMLRDFSHPVHLHGHSFYVVKVGHGNYNEFNGSLMENSDDIMCESTLCMKPTWRDNMAPDFSSYITNGKLNDTTIRKDTVIVPAGGYVVIAFQADNPGYWFLHCHIEVHQLEGMALIIQEYNEAQHNYNGLPQGITRVGNFNWTADDFNEALERSTERTTSRTTPNAASTIWVPFRYTITLLLNIIAAKLLTQLL